MGISGSASARCALIGMVALVSSFSADAQMLAEPERLIRAGEYEKALPLIEEGYVNRAERIRFGTLELRVLRTLGRYDEALAAVRPYWRRGAYDPVFCLEFSRILQAVGQGEQARGLMSNAVQLQIEKAAAEQCAVGEMLLELGEEDPKDVLEKVLQPARAAHPDERPPYLAIGKLGLRSHDRELAAESFREGLKRFPDDADMALGLAEAGAELPRDQRDPENGIASYLDIALKKNPRHPDALLLKGRELSNRKAFEEAGKVLDRLLEINPRHSEAWAEKAAISLILDDGKTAEEALHKAREVWPENPRVPEVVGTALARHYRFAEGISYLEDARKLDPKSVSIRFELGSNLLRFGRIDEGWGLIEGVHRDDPYHVAAFNLITLKDRLANFPILERDGVRVRMSPEDAAVFGERALALAVRSKKTLAEKYGVTLSQPVMVEMLPRQEDFAIRTFGLPGGEAFLGVCFGPLITMTSPRGRLGRNNWESVLWHEMAHTITLEATRHRIPRWLTEGISVYEERQAHAGWGQEMTSAFRERFVSGNFPAIAKLDEAFAGEDIMLGYYQGSLVVEHLFEKFGLEKMRAILADLSAGKPLAEAFSRQAAPLEEIEKSFAAAVKTRAEAYGGDLDWTPLTDEEYRDYRSKPADWVASHPRRYAAVMLLASKHSEAGNWIEARKVLETVVAAEPRNHEEYNPYEALAIACRNLGDSEGERAAWTRLIELDAHSATAAARLVEMAAGRSASERAVESERLLAINPFSDSAYRSLAAAATEAGTPDAARPAFLSLLALDPLDAGRLHYELAALLRESQPEQARLQVLKALEDNPRFQKALELLVLIPPRP